MNLKYINKIKANISIYTNKKSTNILEGSYASIHRGKSMNFENLREYVLQDDIKDIDWKASARSGTLLVKQFIAEKKHNIMFILDTGSQMSGDTDLKQSKKEIALYIAGTLGYLAIKNGDYIGMMYNHQDQITYKPFKYNLYNLEKYLTDFMKEGEDENKEGIEKTLQYVYKHLTKKMIIFVITDNQGISSISEQTLKNLKMMHDVLFISIQDAYMFGDNIYDLDKKSYIPSSFVHDEKMYQLEIQLRKELVEKNEEKFRRNNICVTSISSLEEINFKVIELLERHRYANNR